MQRIVITGGPSVGKTTLIEALKRKGYPAMPEVARRVIHEQLKIKSDALPWKDVTAFSKLVLIQQIKQFEQCSNKVVFLDRGIPDIIGYMNHGQQKLFKELTETANELRYNKVFILPIWEDIFKNDEARKESLWEAKEVQLAIQKSYASLGYNVIEVPKVPVKERVKFIEQRIYG